MEETINWLLDEGNPSVRFFTISQILGKKITPEENSYFEEGIKSVAPASSLLDLLQSDGWWEKEKFSFNPLYKSTFWQLFFLSVLGISKNISPVDQALRLLVKNMQSEKGSFPSQARYKGNLICMQGIALEMLLRFGYLEESFTWDLINFIIDIVFRNDFRCKYRQQLKCPWGAVKILKAFNLIPESQRNESIIKTSQKAGKFLLSHDLVDANYPRKNKKSSQWFLFGFPRGFQSDILEITSTLVDAGFSKQNENLKNALKYVNKKRQPDGKWKLESTLNGRMLVEIEKKNVPSKWITFFSLKSLVKSRTLSL